MVAKHSHRQEIPVYQTVRDLADTVRRGGLKAVNQLPNRHGGEEIVAGKSPLLSGLHVRGPDRDDSIVVPLLDAVHAPPRQNLASLGSYAARHFLPHLPRAVLRV